MTLTTYKLIRAILYIVPTILLIGLVALLYLTPEAALATTPSEDSLFGDANDSKRFYSIFFRIFGFLTGMAGLLLNLAIEELIVNMGALLRSGPILAIDQAWGVVRDIFNLALIFGAIYAGLSTIVNPERTQTRQLVAGLVIAAIVINFSLFIAKVVIDFSNIAAVQIYKLFGPALDAGETLNYGIAGTFMHYMGLVSIGNSSSVQFAEMDFSAHAAYIFGGIIFLIIAAYVFAAGAIMLITRFVILVLLMIFSPVMVLGLIFPQFKDYTKKWWNYLLGYAFVAPAYLFMLYLALVMTEKLQTVLVGNQTLGDTLPGANPDPTAFKVILFFLLICFFMMAAITVAKNMAKAGASTATSIAGAATAGLVATGGRSTIGYLGNRYANSDFGKNVAKRGGAVGRSLLRGADNLGSASFDVRATKAAGKLKSTAIGSDWGEAKKGGYAKRQKDRNEREKKLFDATRTESDEVAAKRHLYRTGAGNFKNMDGEEQDAGRAAVSISKRHDKLHKRKAGLIKKRSEAWTPSGRQKYTNQIIEVEAKIADLQNVSAANFQAGGSLESEGARQALASSLGISRAVVEALPNFNALRTEIKKENIQSQMVEKYSERLSNRNAILRRASLGLSDFLLATRRQNTEAAEFIQKEYGKTPNEQLLAALGTVNTSITNQNS